MEGKYIYKRLLVLYKLLWSVSVRCWSGSSSRGHSVGTAWAQRVLLVLALPQLQLLDLRLPEAEPEHGAVLVLVVIIPNMRDLVHLLQCAGGDQEGGPCLAGREVQGQDSWFKVGQCGEPGVER